jgi:hypothetical protein
MSVYVSFLVENARRLAEVAQTKQSSEAVWTFMIGPEGGIEMVAGADEPLETAILSRGARAVWRVRRERGVVRVEGRMGKERCLIEQPLDPESADSAVLSQSRMYELRHSGTWDA